MVAGLPAVDGRDDLVETALENLVENALSFSGDTGRVFVRLTVEGEAAVLAVEDEGPGVNPGQLEKIFERYYSSRPIPTESSGDNGSPVAGGLASQKDDGNAGKCRQDAVDGQSY